MFATDTSTTTKKMKGDLEAEIVQSLLSGGAYYHYSIQSKKKREKMKIINGKILFAGAREIYTVKNYL